MPWKKGECGNPGGRPKIVGDVQELARQHKAEAILTLASIMRDKKAPPAARALASNSLLDRGFGKPPQTLTASITQRSMPEMTDVELLAIAAGDDIDEGEQPATEH